ncbi:MAG: ATP-dependent 6-phosphofructokinase [Myxococcales bacterium]|nr:ATP-dependent 6-phosphofructokinase [Myxococcales bacterium]MBL0196617.1 ATP-dependent 6-phosphofructokinase [Myxococcales bacterium]HQY60315.1 ATP-dependent 6-phosphofructokinase [Polyangiaceae bacterium]
MITQQDLVVRTLGARTVPSGLGLSTIPGDEVADYVKDGARVLLNVEMVEGGEPPQSLLLEKAGPREEIFFEPSYTTAAIVTCGGLCPGINNVIRSMVLQLHHKYRVRRVIGYRYGYQGLDPASGLRPMELGPDQVAHIHRQGGSFLGLSRGRRDVGVMVDTLVRDGVDILFAIGGDGTQRGARAIELEVERRGLSIAVIGVPKTVDNDVAFVDKTFGFDTAVELARLAVDAAHTEAIGARNGVGIVKLMGRDSGFIAAAAALASRDVNYCLLPEVHYDLEGPEGLFAELEQRLQSRAHALIVVAEGCGPNMGLLPPEHAARDASGNVRYGSAGDIDVGPRLRDAITQHFSRVGRDVTVKYIDPSYMIRSVPANAQDSIFCDALARHAVHAGMAGKTGIIVGRTHRIFTHVPLSVVTSQRKCIDPDGDLWLAVTETTGQPPLRARGTSRSSEFPVAVLD